MIASPVISLEPFVVIPGRRLCVIFARGLFQHQHPSEFHLWSSQAAFRAWSLAVVRSVIHLWSIRVLPFLGPCVFSARGLLTIRARGDWPEPLDDEIFSTGLLTIRRGREEAFLAQYEPSGLPASTQRELRLPVPSGQPRPRATA